MRVLNNKELEGVSGGCGLSDRFGFIKKLIELCKRKDDPVAN